MRIASAPRPEHRAERRGVQSAPKHGAPGHISRRKPAGFPVGLLLPRRAEGPNACEGVAPFRGPRLENPKGIVADEALDTDERRIGPPDSRPARPGADRNGAEEARAATGPGRHFG